MTSPFMDALRRYFADKLGEDPGELRIEIFYDEGYRYSSYTYEDPSFKVRVYQTKDGGSEIDYSGSLIYEDDDGAGEFLQGLFNWEDGMFARQRELEELERIRAEVERRARELEELEAKRKLAELSAERERNPRERLSSALSQHPAWD